MEDTENEASASLPRIIASNLDHALNRGSLIPNGAKSTNVFVSAYAMPKWRMCNV